MSRICVLVLGALLFIAGCGQKGDLYLPASNQQPSTIGTGE